MRPASHVIIPTAEMHHALHVTLANTGACHQGHEKFAWERATLFNTGGISARSAKAWTFLSLWEIDRSVPQGCSPGLEGTAAEAQ